MRLGDCKVGSVVKNQYIDPPATVLWHEVVPEASCGSLYTLLGWKGSGGGVTRANMRAYILPHVPEEYKSGHFQPSTDEVEVVEEPVEQVVSNAPTPQELQLPPQEAELSLPTFDFDTYNGLTPRR